MKPTDIFKMKGYWDKFCQNHPRFPMFLQAARNGMIEEGSIIDLKITSPDGRTINTNVKLTASDLEMFREMGQQ